MIDLTWPSPVSNLFTTNKFDTYVNNDDDSQDFATPIKHNHSVTEFCDTNTKPTQVQIKAHPRLF